jgi:hypothetical protein
MKRHDPSSPSVPHLHPTAWSSPGSSVNHLGLHSSSFHLCYISPAFFWTSGASNLSTHSPYSAGKARLPTRKSYSSGQMRSMAPQYHHDKAECFSVAFRVPSGSGGSSAGHCIYPTIFTPSSVLTCALWPLSGPQPSGLRVDTFTDHPSLVPLLCWPPGPA